MALRQLATVTGAGRASACITHSLARSARTLPSGRSSFLWSFVVLPTSTPQDHIQVGATLLLGSGGRRRGCLLVSGVPAPEPLGTYKQEGFLLEGSTPVPAELSQCVK